MPPPSLFRPVVEFPKWALEGVSEQLALEVAGFGIRVAIVEPGVTQSSIFGKNADMPNDTGAYGPAYERMMQMYAAGASNATPAVEVDDGTGLVDELLAVTGRDPAWQPPHTDGEGATT